MVVVDHQIIVYLVLQDIVHQVMVLQILVEEDVVLMVKIMLQVLLANWFQVFPEGT